MPGARTLLFMSRALIASMASKKENRIIEAAITIHNVSSVIN